MIDFKSRKTERGTLVIQPSGQLDHDTNQYFFECIKDEIEAGNLKIVINFEDLGYISSIGLGALVRKRQSQRLNPEINGELKRLDRSYRSSALRLRSNIFASRLTYKHRPGA